MSGGIGNLGAANLLKNKNDAVKAQYERAEGWMKHAKALQRKLDILQQQLEHAKALQRKLDILQQQLDILTPRNAELEWFGKSLAEKGVASAAFGTIHVMKAWALQKQADEEHWSIEKKRETNLRLAAEAEYDYRLKNVPSYRLNTVADSIMGMANFAESEEQIRDLVAQMYAAGKIPEAKEKDRIIEERIAEMKAAIKYDNGTTTLPIPDSVPPARLDNLEGLPEYEVFSELAGVTHPDCWVT